MRRIRVIPALLLHKGGLVKSVRFKNYQYIGDPINAVKIFNEKEVDEIALIDIDAGRERRGPDIKKIAEIAGEAFMPMAYGGGITSLNQAKALFYNGVEKIILNKSAVQQPSLVTEIASLFGSQSVMVSIDVKRTLFKGYRVYTDNGRHNTGLTPKEFARKAEDGGAGEILLNNIDREGTYTGYDTDLIEEVSSSISIPLIAMGGASSTDDFKKAIERGASAVAAGSMFVFQRPHQAVLISYPDQEELRETVYSRI